MKRKWKDLESSGIAWDRREVKVTSESWDLAMSARIFAAGWTMSRSFMMVAPSLEMVTVPLSSWMSLSMPRGSRVVRTTSATAVQALMLLTSCGFPCQGWRCRRKRERQLGFKFWTSKVGREVAVFWLLHFYLFRTDISFLSTFGPPAHALSHQKYYNHHHLVYKGFLRVKSESVIYNNFKFINSL